MEPEDLAVFPLLSHSIVPQDWTDWRDWFEGVGARQLKRPRLVPFDSYPVALQAAVAGQGVALGWRRTTEGMIAEGKLIRPCKQVLKRPTEISVFRGVSRNHHPKTDQLIAWLGRELAQ